MTRIVESKTSVAAGTTTDAKIGYETGNKSLDIFMITQKRHFVKP